MIDHPPRTAQLALHAIEWASWANGPGQRAVIWTQGCTLGCAGCFNPLTHSFGYTETDVEELAQRLAQGARDGITITGGEPFQQWVGVKRLLHLVRARRRKLSVLVFTGYTVEELQRDHSDADEMFELVDVLVAGRYNERLRLTGTSLLGSSNQRIHLFSDRHTFEELDRVPLSEVIIDPSGTITFTGVAPAVASIAEAGVNS